MSEHPNLLKSVLIFTNPKGQHNSSLAYQKMDEVQYQTSIYVATEDIPAGVAISDARWAKKLDNSTAYQAELARQTAEGEREQAEDSRETAEGLREQGEIDRDNAYSQAETARDGLYATAESARDGLFNAAQQDRTSAYNLRENQRDDAYAAAELIREGAETARETAEGLRDEAEGLRASAETSRNTAEGLRDSAETARDEAETLRIAAEAARMGFKPMGAYNPANENKYGEWYTHNGGSYGYIWPEPSTGVPVTDTSHWQQIASQGDTGLSAYEAAVDAGYQGSEEDFEQAIAALPTATQEALDAADNANEAAGRVDITLAGSQLMFKTTLGNPVTCYPVPESKMDYTVKLQATQSGTGDPSPENVRPIIPSVAVGASVKVKATGKNCIDLGSDKISSLKGFYAPSTAENKTEKRTKDIILGAIHSGFISSNIGQATFDKYTGKITIITPFAVDYGIAIRVKNHVPGSTYYAPQAIRWTWAAEDGTHISGIVSGLSITPPDNAKHVFAIFGSNAPAGTVIDAYIGRVSGTTFEPYTEHEVEVANTTGQDLYGLSGAPVEVRDGQVINRTGYIASYIDEVVPAGYLSSTGGLDAGAQIVYPMDEPVVTALTTPALNSIPQLDKYTPRQNVVTADKGQVQIGYAKSLNKYYEDVNFQALNYLEKTVGASKSGLKAVYLFGDTTGMTKDVANPMAFKLWDGRSGDCTVKWQGSSSINYPKKNFNITLGTGLEILPAWGVQKEYCFKANFIDFSHARNNVGAKLWGDIVKSRSPVPAWVANTPNAGAIDGFPIMLFINDEYYGLMSFNVPKDKWQFGMSGVGTGAVLSAESYTQAVLFNGLALCDGTDFKIEHSENMTNQQVKDSINAVIGKIMTYDASVWDSLDLGSTIDAAIFTFLVTGTDLVAKNYLLSTFDGIKWYWNEYDIDSVFGNHFNGSSYYAIGVAPHVVTPQHYAWQKVMSEKKTEFKARYATLRAGVLSEDKVYERFYNYMADIPKALKDKECVLWPQTPGTGTNAIDQIMNNYRLRSKFIDGQVDSL